MKTRIKSISILIGLTTLTIGAFVGYPAHAQTEIQSRPNLARDVSLDQKLDEQLPLDTPFKDENGKDVKLGDYFNGHKPVILVLPFYRCAGSCALELEGMISCFNKLDMQMGKDYDVLTVSIHPKETPEIAAAKKKTLLEIYKKGGAEANWHFLTGNWNSITRLTQTVGFRFVYDEKKDQIAHAAGIMVLTPQGKTSRYFYGINYKPKDVRLSLVEASANKIGNFVDKVTLYCSAFDMSTGKYTISIIRILQVACAGTFFLLAGSILVLAIQNRRVALKVVPGTTGSLPPTSA